jgi:ABC-type nickel/cobalt efflux system permease component RcnA
VGLIALIMVHWVADYYHFQQRTGFNKYSPYIFLLLLYGWIVFHNLILFDGLFLKGKKRQYFIWTGIALLICSLNMFFILHFGFEVANPFPQIMNFWIYTLLGLGVYMIYRYLKIHREKVPNPHSQDQEHIGASQFIFMADGKKHLIPYEKILYLESLENYIKVHTPQKSFIVRMPLKEAELELPSPFFLRISRSHIINTQHIESFHQDSLKTGGKVFKVGKVYKKYVEDQLAIGRING